MSNRRSASWPLAVLAGALLVGCGGERASGVQPDSSTSTSTSDADRLQAARRRTEQPGYRRQRRAASYARVGLRPVDPPGEIARQLRQAVQALVPAGASDQELSDAGLAILSLGDGDSAGDLGEELRPSDREDVGVSFRPLVPGSPPGNTRAILDLNVRQVEQALRRQGGDPRIRSAITGDVARVTAAYETDDGTVRERTAVALTECSLVQMTGWIPHVERVLGVATRARP